MDQYGPVYKKRLCEICFQRNGKRISHRHLSTDFQRYQNQYCNICKKLHSDSKYYPNTYFVGSSTFHATCLEKEVIPNTCLNVETVPGLTFSKMLSLLKNLKCTKKGYFFLNVGLNDVNQNRNLDVIELDIKKISEYIRGQNPDNHVVFLDCFIPPKLSQHPHFAVNSKIQKMNDIFKNINSNNYQIPLHQFGTRRLKNKLNNYFRWSKWRENKYSEMYHLNNDTQKAALKYIYKHIGNYCKVY